MIQCDRGIKARKPDIVVVNKNEGSWAIIDIAIPGDIRVNEKEKEKIERYQKLLGRSTTEIVGGGGGEGEARFYKMLVTMVGRRGKF